MKEMLAKTKRILNERSLSLVVIKDNEIFTSDKKGVLPVLELLEDGKATLSNAVAADKVIGGAAAYLFVKGGISEVYGDLMSEKGVAVLEQSGIPYFYGTLVPYIINRKGDDFCPLEKLCMDCDNAEDAYKRIKGFLKQ